MKSVKNILFLFFALMLQACDNQKTSKLLTFEPSSLEKCEPGSEVNVKWNITSENSNITTVQLFVSDGSKEILFAEGNAMGEATTGPWARAGNPTFILKEKSNGKVIAEAKIQGPRCP